MVVFAALWLILCGLAAFGVLILFNLALVRFIELLVPPIGRFIEVGGERLEVGAARGQGGAPFKQRP